MKKRLISLLLVFTMLFSLFPATALAAPESRETGNVNTANPFTDVKEGDWCYDAVQYARMNGFFNGTSETTFAPNGTMTRGMFDLSFLEGDFLRDDLAGLTYQALACKLSDGSATLIDSLIASEAIDAKAAEPITKKMAAYRELTAATGSDCTAERQTGG